MTTVVFQGLISEPWSSEKEHGATYSEFDSFFSIPVIFDVHIEAKIIDAFVKYDKKISDDISVEGVGQLQKGCIKIDYLEVKE
jgi:hypothetical protein